MCVVVIEMLPCWPFACFASFLNMNYRMLESCFSFGCWWMTVTTSKGSWATWWNTFMFVRKSITKECVEFISLIWNHWRKASNSAGKGEVDDTAQLHPCCTRQTQPISGGTCVPRIPWSKDNLCGECRDRSDCLSAPQMLLPHHQCIRSSPQHPHSFVT